jgi:type IX secretion system PorP/SprF family membrane protein
MARFATIALFMLCMFSPVKAQQDVLYSQYMFDKMLLNPAYSGSSRWVVGSVKSRLHFVNLNGAPRTNIFSFQAPYQEKNIGMGAKIVQDQIAVTSNLTATGFFSYHIGFGNGKLSFGLEGGIISSSFNYDDLIRYDIDDPDIPTGGQSHTRPDFSTGLFYQSNSFYLGASVYHLFASAAPGETSDFYPLVKSYYGMGGYYLELSNDIILEPGFLMRYNPGAPLQADINLSLILNRLAFGISFRTGDSFIGLFKLDVTKNLKILYSYDYTISSLGKYSNGSHEIGISYGIELLPPPAKKVVHPRYYF